MGDKRNIAVKSMAGAKGSTNNVTKFAESYASFNRIINNLQRQYIELKEEFSAQNSQLADANQKLLDLAGSNLAATEFLNGILNSIPVGVISIDREGMITHFNPASSLMLEVQAKDALGRPYNKVIPGGSDAEASALGAVETGKEISSVEKKVEFSNGRSMSLSVSAAILKDEAGNCTGAVEVIQDLTKIRRMEQEIARLNTLAVMGEMAATIAHEVRNPLSGIGGFASLLEKDLAEDDSKRAVIGKIKRGVEILDETVSKLLNYTRFNELNRTEVNYIEFIQSLIDQFNQEQETSDKTVQVELVNEPEVDNSQINVSIDRLLYRQCLFNILSNSVDAVDDDGKIQIGVRVYPQNKVPSSIADKIHLDYDEMLLVTTILDDGPGIKSDHRDNIFTPFFTTKDGGNGLGLAVAWKLVKAHGGEVILDDSAQEGAQFHVLLPARLGLSQLENSK